MSYPPQPPPQDPNQPPPVSGPPYGAPPPGYPPQAPGYPPQFQQQAPGYPPQFQQQQPPVKRRKKWPWIVGGIVVVMILGCVGVFAVIGFGAKAVSEGLDEVDQNQKGQNAAAGKMNTPATDGKFQFTVTAAKCGAKSVGEGIAGAKAQGQFCLVSVTVKNVGKDAELFDGTSQKGYDAKGTEFSTDAGAGMYVNDQSQTFLEDINPGNQVKGVLVFDIPVGTKLASVVLHESFFTAGVKVPLA